MAPVYIYLDVLEGMVEHARREYPLESCGLLSGTGQAIDGIRSTSNQKRSRKEFFVPFKELFLFFKELRRTGKQHLGIYHSHPTTDAVPSTRDVAEFHYPEVSYWIVSLKEKKPDIRCFLWKQAGFQEAPFTVMQGPCL
ncbi:MAG: M67 family metallopeptidase [Acidobacteriota bacterium]